MSEKSESELSCFFLLEAAGLAAALVVIFLTGDFFLGGSKGIKINFVIRS